MVLRGKLCGRVGSRRDYLKARSNQVRAGFLFSRLNSIEFSISVPGNNVDNVVGLRCLSVIPQLSVNLWRQSLRVIMYENKELDQTSRLRWISILSCEGIPLVACSVSNRNSC